MKAQTITQLFNKKTIIGTAILAATAAMFFAVLAVKPASAASQTVFSSSTLDIFACKSSSTGYKFGVHNKTPGPIHEVRFTDDGGQGNYLNYIPDVTKGGSKWGDYAQRIQPAEVRHVSYQRFSTSQSTPLGSFTFDPAALPAC